LGQQTITVTAWPLLLAVQQKAMVVTQMTLQAALEVGFILRNQSANIHCSRVSVGLRPTAEMEKNCLQMRHLTFYQN